MTGVIASMKSLAICQRFIDWDCGCIETTIDKKKIEKHDGYL